MPFTLLPHPNNGSKYPCHSSVKPEADPRSRKPPTQRRGHATAKEERDGNSWHLRGYERLRGSLGAKRLRRATALWADDIVKHVPGKRPLAGDFSGKSAFLDHYGKVFSELGGTTEVVEVRDVLVSEEHGVALVKAQAVRAERSLTFHRVVVYLISGGKIVKTWPHDYYLYTLDEFWS